MLLKDVHKVLREKFEYKRKNAVWEGGEERWGPMLVESNKQAVKPMDKLGF